VAVAIVVLPFLALMGVFIGLWVTGTELNITAMMGMTMVVGIITECAIFYFSAVHDGLARGIGISAALIRAGRYRARPLAMTTLAAILALLPLALGVGEGANMLHPLAIAIIAGLILQLPLVLLASPVFYLLLFRVSNSLARWCAAVNSPTDRTTPSLTDS
ncbi:MAG: efflux RND transporter permease subunit, partial [Gammaproteobacteria bacterium]